MSEPITLSIHGKRWKIVFKRTAGNWGLCDCEKRTIYLDPELEGSKLAKYAIHEVAHAVDHETEERKAQIIATATHRVLTKLGLI
jgi:hypothetical protein